MNDPVPDPRLDALAGTPGALLVVDVQRSFADPRFLTHVDPAGRQAVAAAVRRVGQAVEAARSGGFGVVWCRLRVRADDPWPASNWLRGLGPDDPWPNAWEPCVEGTDGIEWYGVGPADGEVVVDKRTYDGFAGTTLARDLRGTSWVAVAGLTTDCCVLETAGSAFTHGLRVVVLADACAAEDPANHDAALRVLGTHSAVVSDVAWFAGAVRAAGAGQR
ncbi:cysteine hydrolase family protein [Kineococcus rhizosphaerae]|uniref:Nicotinamidase-related amidase n=1 Tax=Kineococcus rhizosphaerae TaxID=559628 RepID=A0A2T0R9H1_9ACTN|nr:cysteine hydrolase [Kineococcus rhizosphaerae]PRY17816.1 nicotinamidase-related amidase [Kineococcus rhizosphaerae]